MDDELLHLERAHSQDPGDLEVARRLKTLLVRQGRQDEVRTRFRLGFVCDVRWDAMARTDDPQVRRCATCQRDVHTAASYEEFELHAARGRCVSVEPRRLPLVLDPMMNAPEFGLRRAAKDPCVVEGDDGPPPEELRMAGVPMPLELPEPEKKGLLARLLGLFGA